MEFLAGNRIRGTLSERTGLTTTIGSATDVTWGTGLTMTDSGNGTATQTNQDSWTEFAPANNAVPVGGYVQASATSTHWTFGLNNVQNRNCFGCNVYYVHPTYSNTILLYDYTSGSVSETTVSGWSQSDVMKLEVDSSSNIKFYQNGVLKDTSDATISTTVYPSVNMYKTGVVTMDYTPENPALPDGSIFYETDTNKSYVLYNGSWTEL